MTNEQKFTAFRRSSDGTLGYLCRSAGSPGDFMLKVEQFYSDGWCGTPDLVAWAPEYVFDQGGRLKCEALCAESVAAGRVIKQVDGKYVAFGVAHGVPEDTFYVAEPLKPQACCCGEPEASGVVHRTDAPCYHEQSPEVDTTWRPPLTWADKTPFDKFSDFAVSTDTNEPDHAYSHPTTRIADAGAQTNPKHGSAWLAG